MSTEAIETHEAEHAEEHHDVRWTAGRLVQTARGGETEAPVAERRALRHAAAGLRRGEDGNARLVYELPELVARAGEAHATTGEDRRTLRDNLEILQNCDFNARIEGYASRDERNVDRLSEDRARAVMQFYIDNGIDASRLTAVGMGATGQTTKKGGASQFRRADTIPLN